MDAVWQEMKKVRVVIEEYEGDPNQLVGYTEITGHILFDFKYGENFRRDSGYCAGGLKPKHQHLRRVARWYRDSIRT